MVRIQVSGDQRFRGWGKIHRWIFRLQVTLVVPEPWVTSDSRLVGSLLVAEWWPDETSSESKDFFVCQEDAALLPEQQKAWQVIFSLLHASCFSYQQFLHCLLVANFPSFQRSLQCQRSMILGPAQKSLSDVSSLPKYLTDLQGLQKCLWQPQDLDWYIGSLNLHGNRRWGIWMRQWRCHRASLWWGFWCAQQ